MVNVDFSIIIQIINFLVLIAVLNMVLYKPIRKILLERKDKINGLERHITDRNKEAEEKDKAFAAGIKAARIKGREYKESLLNEAADQEKAIIEKINEKAKAELSEVKEKIATDTQVVRESLQKDVDVFAEIIGNKILGRAT